MNSSHWQESKLSKEVLITLYSMVTIPKVTNARWPLSAILNFSGHIGIYSRNKKTSILKTETDMLVQICASFIVFIQTRKIVMLCRPTISHCISRGRPRWLIHIDWGL